MFCVKCGSKIPDGANFCSKCGTKVAVVDDAASDDVLDTASEQTNRAEKGIITVAFAEIEPIHKYEKMPDEKTAFEDSVVYVATKNATAQGTFILTNRRFIFKPYGGVFAAIGGGATGMVIHAKATRNAPDTVPLSEVRSITPIKLPQGKYSFCITHTEGTEWNFSIVEGLIPNKKKMTEKRDRLISLIESAL